MPLGLARGRHSSLARRKLGKATYVSASAPQGRKGASLRKRRPLLTHPWAWKAKPTEGYIAKGAPFWSFLNTEKVYRQGTQNQLCERSTETDVF